MAKELLVSDETINSHNLRVRTSGIDFSRFEKNPIMLLNHIRIRKYSDKPILPLGIWKDWRIENGDVFATPVFDSKDDKLAAKIEKKYNNGVLRSASIGIIPLVVSYGGKDENGNDFYWIDKCILMEISIVDIPSNQNAVAFYNEKQEKLSLNAVVNMAASSTEKIVTMEKFTFVPAMLGLTASASEEDVRKKLTALMALQAKNTELAAENQTLKDAAQVALDANIIALVDQAIADKKILPVAKDQFVKLAKADFETTKGILDGMTATTVNLSDTTKPPATPSAAPDNGVMKFEGMTFSEMQRKASDKLANLKANDFATFNSLYKSEFGKDYKVSS